MKVHAMTNAETLKNLRRILESIYNSGSYTSHTQRQLNTCFALIGQLEVDETLVDQIMHEIDDMHVIQPDSDFTLRNAREAFDERINEHFNDH